MDRHLIYIYFCIVTRPAQPATEQFLISPITGEKIPADKMQEHMRIGKIIFISFVALKFAVSLLYNIIINELNFLFP